MGEQFEGVYRLLSYVVSTAILITLGILFWVNSWVFWGFAILVFVCVCLVIIDFTARRLTRYTWQEITSQGLTGQDMLGRRITIAPQATHTDAREKAVTVTPAIPTLAEMLTDNLLGAGTLYHGYQLLGKKQTDLTPLTGVFDSVRTFAILGKGGSGKTVRLFFLLIQFIMEGATIYLCDPHSNAKGSITKLLGPLITWVQPAITDPQGDIEAQNMAHVSRFTEEMHERLKDDSKDYPPCILVIDEFGTMMEHELYGEACVDAVVGCANKYRKVNGYAVVILHEVVATGKGKKVQDLVARLRRGLHAIFIMRIDKEYAKFFLSGKQLRQVDHLKTGRCIFIDTESAVHEDVYTPKSMVSDAFTIARKLQMQVSQPYEPLQIGNPREQIAYYRPREDVTVTPYTPMQQLPERAFLPGNAGESVNGHGARVTTDTTRSPLQVNAPEKPGNMVTAEDEQAILKAYFLLDADKPGKVTRGDILVKLGWNRKKWTVLKAVCDKYHIVIPQGGQSESL